MYIEFPNKITFLLLEELIYICLLKQINMINNQPGPSIPPTSVDDLRNKLRNGPVRFAFRKKDGSLRLAYGTLDLSKIPDDQHPKSGNEASPLILPFYDLEKFAWRSISIGQLIFS
jgi:hypothetical protein